MCPSFAEGTPYSTDSNRPSFANPAVARCTRAWQETYKRSNRSTRNPVGAAVEARRAYRDLMPPLIGYNNICDFIACTTQGIILCVFREAEASRLLYAAQIALSTLSRQPKTTTPLQDSLTDTQPLTQ